MMNERIKELMPKLSNLNPFNGAPIYGYTALQMERFTELIVRECALFLENNSGYDSVNNSWHPEPDDLRKHFGVEE